MLKRIRNMANDVMDGLDRFSNLKPSTPPPVVMNKEGFQEPSVQYALRIDEPKEQNRFDTHYYLQRTFSKKYGKDLQVFKKNPKSVRGIGNDSWYYIAKLDVPVNPESKKNIRFRIHHSLRRSKRWTQKEAMARAETLYELHVTHNDFFSMDNVARKKLEKAQAEFENTKNKAYAMISGEKKLLQQPQPQTLLDYSDITGNYLPCDEPPKDTLMKDRKKVASDGLSTSYYKIPEHAEELRHLISHKGMSKSRGDIFKACYRLGEKHGTEIEYDLNKMKFFINDLIEMHSRGEHL